MIVFFSDGRLGNQIFQYAFLNTISKKNEKIITIDMDQFLEVFICHNKKNRNYQVGRYKRFFMKKIFKKLLHLFIKLKLIGYIKQCRNEVSALPFYLEKKGIFPIKYVETNFFQSEKFFDVRKLDFEIKSKYIEQSSKILSSIENIYTKVFVHIRRGDYLFESFLDNKGINLPKKYFLRAISKIESEVDNPYFIFLSDDTEFVECCFSHIKNKYISRNSMAIDLSLMTLCEYGITSNSSFSWWGAYLMKNRKKVIFPKYWYGWKSKVESHISIYPKWADIFDINEI